MPVIQCAFKPAWWLRGAHAQTIWASLFRLKPRLKIEWQRVELPDGDFIDLACSGTEME
jgi:predicted alpha/beta-fold hydrolase